MGMPLLVRLRLYLYTEKVFTVKQCVQCRNKVSSVKTMISVSKLRFHCQNKDSGVKTKTDIFSTDQDILNYG